MMKKKIAELIRKLYKFHEYEISADKLQYLTNIIYKMRPNVDDKTLTHFFSCVEQGQFGMLYRYPTCLTSMYYQYQRDNRELPKVPDNFGKVSPTAITREEYIKQKRIYKKNYSNETTSTKKIN